MWLTLRRLVSRMVPLLLSMKKPFSTMIEDGNFARFKTYISVGVETGGYYCHLWSDFTSTFQSSMPTFNLRIVRMQNIPSFVSMIGTNVIPYALEEWTSKNKHIAARQQPHKCVRVKVSRDNTAINFIHKTLSLENLCPLPTWLYQISKVFPKT